MMLKFFNLLDKKKLNKEEAIVFVGGTEEVVLVLPSPVACNFAHSEHAGI